MEEGNIPCSRTGKLNIEKMTIFLKPIDSVQFHFKIPAALFYVEIKNLILNLYEKETVQK